jgi:hypothetical protein
MFKNKLLSKILLAVFNLLLCMFSYSCGSTGPDERLEFGLYKLKDESIYWYLFQQIEYPDTLEIKEWITPNMIKSYDFSSHIIILDMNAIKNLPGWDKGVFVAVVGGKRCYYGSMYSFAGQGKTPAFAYCPYPATDMIWIRTNSNFYYKDERNDETIKEALKSSGKYAGGIKVTLDNLTAVEEGSSTLFEYSFTITNIDNWNLYVIDPKDWVWNQENDHIDNTDLFIYEYGDHNYANYQLIPSFNPNIKTRMITEYSLKPENLLYIKHGESVKRTFKQTLYSGKLPYGNHLAILKYVNMLGSTAEQRTIQGGRVLNGYVYSNILDFTYSQENGIVINNRNVIFP